MNAIGRYQTELGFITVRADETAVTAVCFTSESDCFLPEKRSVLTDSTALQIREYLAGCRREFDLPLRPSGTPFQQRVWSALLNIPYGEVRTYTEIAAAIGSPRAARPVGSACGANPLFLLVPCHRVVAKHGIGGYGGDVARKRQLLLLEGIAY
ncbi:MAG: methylated-DNA--[protein]-cysteine S-methyltransferase [Clostridiales bacterium]|nr:methylated-DNA--[protein]-cysteine S-methyltransferase [Clostridiales bacterium]